MSKIFDHLIYKTALKKLIFKDFMGLQFKFYYSIPPLVFVILKKLKAWMVVKGGKPLFEILQGNNSFFLKAYIF
jgi:hypothetical protein